MKIFINRKIVNGPWGGGNHFIKNIFRYGPEFGHEITNNLNDKGIDVAHIQDLHSDSLGVSSSHVLDYQKSVNPKLKIVHRVNDMDLGRYDCQPWREKAYADFSKRCDATIFVSDWTKNYFIEKGWHCKKTFSILNGVDKKIFKPQETIDNQKINIVTHHWSNNRGKGLEIYKKIDDFVSRNKDYTFTYIGQPQNYLKNSRCIGPFFGEQLGKELSRYNLYISASEYENCPNHILESLACEIPTFALSGFRGGASVGLVGDDFTYKNWEELEKILLAKKFSKNTAYEVQSWQECMGMFFKAYESVF